MAGAWLVGSSATGRRRIHLNPVRCSSDDGRMPRSDHVARLLPLVREYGRLERMRTKQGVTPEEYERWSKLKAEIGRAIPQGNRPEGAERREHIRLPTRMLVDFRDRGELKNALIRNISRGGLYIASPHLPNVGTNLDLVIKVGGGRGKAAG